MNNNNNNKNPKQKDPQSIKSKHTKTNNQPAKPEMAVRLLSLTLH